MASLCLHAGLVVLDWAESGEGGGSGGKEGEKEMEGSCRWRGEREVDSNTTPYCLPLHRSLQNSEFKWFPLILWVCIWIGHNMQDSGLEFQLK